jgi:hypothetical protein
MCKYKRGEHKESMKKPSEAYSPVSTENGPISNGLTGFVEIG